MLWYSVQPRTRIFVKGYEFLSFAKNLGRNFGKNISKNLSGRYSQKLLDHAKQSTTNVSKTMSKIVMQKKSRRTGGLSGNDIVDIISKTSKNSKQINSETVLNEHDKEIPKERFISPEERQKNYRWSEINRICQIIQHINHLNWRQKFRLKWMMTHVERTTPIGKLKL